VSASKSRHADGSAAAAELTRRIIEAVPGGLVQVRADGSIASANAEALRILGLSYDELTQRYTQDFEADTIWEDGSPCLPADYPVMRALQTGERQPAVLIGVRRGGGETAWAMFTAVPLLDEQSHTAGAVVTLVDVTRQRELDVALRHSEARLRAMVESVPGYVLLVDRELRIRFCNRLLPGLERTQVMGQSVIAFVAEADRAAFAARLEHAIASESTQTFEVSVDAWLGSGTFRIAAGPVKEGNVVSGVTVIAEDISTQKEMETRLLLSERLASIGTLAAGVAHEINNPLTYVLGNLELLKPELKEQTALAALLEQITEGAERIANVVADLMSFSHREEGPLGAVSVSEAVDRAARVAHHELQRKARFVREPFDVPPVYGGPARIGQVLLNILINAAHAVPLGMPERHEIRVSACVIPEDRVRISVRDTGRGIDRTMLSRIFDPFITTKPTGEGTGLGLYVCHNIVRSLGGAIWVESQPGKGSTFHVDLPIYRGEAARRQKDAVRSAEKTERSLQLLVIDDEPSITAFVRHALRQHEVATAACGRDALLALETLTFDGILCDLVMPDLSGVEVFQHVKATRPELAQRFLFITGAALRDLAPEVVRSGVPVLYKPFSVRDLREAVQRLTDGAGVCATDTGRS
jgi:two-component system cell cycle sensor histidine kinase/response regulator CckA